MDLDVRPIRADEMPDWVATMHTAFHSDRASEAESDYRLGDYGQDLQRTLAAFDGARLVGTYESFPTELTLPGGCCVKVNGISAGKGGWRISYHSQTPFVPALTLKGLLVSRATSFSRSSRTRCCASW